MALKKWASGKRRGHRDERKEQARKTRRVEDKEAVKLALLYEAQQRLLP